MPGCWAGLASELQMQRVHLVAGHAYPDHVSREGWSKAEMRPPAAAGHAGIRLAMGGGRLVIHGPDIDGDRESQYASGLLGPAPTSLGDSHSPEPDAVFQHAQFDQRWHRQHIILG